MNKIVILMSTYNGHKYLSEQFESIINQSIRNDNNYELSIYVRDDGSLDDTMDIISNFSDRIKIEKYAGENVGPARSFWELVNKAPDAEYYAFCDQDDVWFEDKLKNAISHMLDLPNINKPMLYCSAVDWTDAELNSLPIYYSKEKQTDFPHALLYSISPGCTYVFNRAALKAARKYDFKTGHIEIHDWLLYKIVSMLGTVYYDSKPGMHYRQHGGNTIGRKNDGFRGFLDRTKRFLFNDAGGRSATAESIMKFYGDELSNDSEEYYFLDLVANYKKSLKKRIKFLHEKRFRRKTSDTFFLKVLIIFGKV